MSGFGGGGNGFRGGGPRGGGVSPAGQNAGPGGPGGDATANNGLLSYLEEHQGTTKYLVAVQDSNNAAAYIIQTGKPVMSLGGFSGNDPILTLDGLKALIKNNTVRYFSGVGSRGSDNGIATWVQSACTAVPASAYGGSNITSSSGQVLGAGGPGTGALGGFRGNGQELYDCAGAVK